VLSDVRGAGAGSTQEFLVMTTPPSTVPEPGTMALMATGLASLAGTVRRRRRKAAAEREALETN
jgi:hypothetical protein